MGFAPCDGSLYVDFPGRAGHVSRAVRVSVGAMLLRPQRRLPKRGPAASPASASSVERPASAL